MWEKPLPRKSVPRALENRRARMVCLSARLSMRYTLMTLRAIGERGTPRLLTHFGLCERLQVRCGRRRIWCSNFAVLSQYKNFPAIRPFAHTNPLNPIGFHVWTDVRPSVDANSFYGWGSFELTLKLESAILCRS